MIRIMILDDDEMYLKKKKKEIWYGGKKTQLARSKTDWYDDLHSNPVPDRNKYIGGNDNTVFPMFQKSEDGMSM